MNKKVILPIAAIVCALLLFYAQVYAAAAEPTRSAILVNKQSVEFDAYNIDGSNYFKLRDLAYTLNGTEKQFAIDWDGEANAISLSKGRPYTIAGGEMTDKGDDQALAVPTDSMILLDGVYVQFTAYNIGGFNYFKLRDIGAAFNFGVEWDETNDVIVIDTSKDYTQEGAASGGMIGVWRYESDADVEFLLLNANNTFQIGVYNKEEGPTNVTSGEYMSSGELLYMTNADTNGEPVDDFTMTFELKGISAESALINGITYERVPAGDAFVVLSDPWAPYPPKTAADE